MYVVGFQANNDPNSVPYAFAASPYLTRGGGFEVLSGGPSALITVSDPTYITAEMSLDVVPEPSTLTFFGIGLFVMVACAWCRKPRLAV